jgi:hypothetical protein
MLRCPLRRSNPPGATVKNQLPLSRSDLTGQPADFDLKRDLHWLAGSSWSAASEGKRNRDTAADRGSAAWARVDLDGAAERGGPRDGGPPHLLGSGTLL